jgi:hypothetical protein
METSLFGPSDPSLKHLSTTGLHEPIQSPIQGWKTVVHSWTNKHQVQWAFGKLKNIIFMGRDQLPIGRDITQLAGRVALYADLRVVI